MKPFKRSAILFFLVVLVAVVGYATPANAQGSAPPVTNILVRNGTQPGEVVVSWDAVPQATHYRIGYVNMETDYPLAKASVTGEWVEAFVYVDVNARNFTVAGGRTEYTIRRLAQGVRHAFTVLTSNNFANTTQSVSGEFSWPSDPRWEFFTTLDQGGACPTAPSATTPPTNTTPPVTTPQTPLSSTELVRRVKPALAKIVVTDSDGGSASGTGFVVHSDGLVVTNRHVVDDASTVSVLMHAPDGSVTEFTGSVLGRGILADLAVIRLPAGRTYTALSLGNSDDVVQGDEITAWGYALGSFLGSDPTLTRGIISSTNRVFDDTQYLQTDASIAPGNSGGPVVDRFGRVVGVNTAGLVLIQEDGTRVPVPGIYLAIVSNEVSSRLNTIAAGGPVQATYHNLHFDYGYSVDIPRGWYISSELETTSIFLPYATDRYFGITRVPFIEPYGTKSAELALYADWYWNTRLPEFAAENWVFFQPTSLTTVNVRGTDFYRVEYRRRTSSEFCIETVVQMIAMSSSFPGKPLGFFTTSGICQDSLTTQYSSERETMLSSFRP